MKKRIIIVLIACLLMLCGCSNAKTLNPNQLKTGSDKVLTMYETKSTIDENLGKEGENYLVSLWDYDEIRIAHSKYRTENQLTAVCFYVDDPSYKTYGDISVNDTWADAIEKLNKATSQSVEEYLSVNEIGDTATYTIVFDDGKLVPVAQRNSAEDDWLMISYDVEDVQIKEITIGDAKFIQTLM